MSRMAPAERDLVTGPTPRSVIFRFAAGTLVAPVVAVVGGYFVLRSVAIGEAKRQTRTRVQEEARLVEGTVGDGLLAGRPEAVRAVDDVVVSRILSGSIVRVKIWSADGRVLYSDEPAEVGRRYALDAAQHLLLRNGGARVEVTDLSRPENTLDRQDGRLIEAYTRIRTPSGTRCCSRSTSVSDRSRPRRAGCSRRLRLRSWARSGSSCSFRSRSSGPSCAGCS